MVCLPVSRVALIAGLAGMMFVGGCKNVPGHQGFVSDPVLIQSVKAGVDNRDSVEKTLGRPTFAGQFTDRDWYYVSIDTRTYAYKLPRPVNELVTHVHFDTDGNVDSVKLTGIDKAVLIHPVKDKTPTLGRDRTLFEDLFGNIGQVGAIGKSGGTTDNPNGN